jgi:hypothetical protein
MTTEGFCVIRGMLPADAALRYGEAIMAEYARLEEAGWTFTGGGHIEGHLNVIPGEPARELVEAAQRAGLGDVISQVAGEPMDLVRMAGNLALPKSHAQNYHPDTSQAEQTWVVNIALVPISPANGAMALIAGTQALGENYAKFRWARLEGTAVQPSMEPGDLLLRLSTVWHRGTHNPSNKARPMGMLGYRPAALGLPPLTIKPGSPITISSNRYYGKHARLREIVAIRLRPAYELMRIAAARSR